MTIQEVRAGRAKSERLHAEAQQARRAHAIRRLRLAAWLRTIADRLVA